MEIPLNRFFTNFTYLNRPYKMSTKQSHVALMHHKHKSSPPDNKIHKNINFLFPNVKKTT